MRDGGTRSGWKLCVLTEGFGIAFSCGLSQANDHFEAKAKRYVNDQFHFAYFWPKFMIPLSKGSFTQAPPLQPFGPWDEESRFPGRAMLFVAIDPVGQDRIIIRSVKMHLPTMWEPHGFENGRDLLRAIGHSSDGVEFQLVVSSKHLVINDGIIADEVDYSNDNRRVRS